MSEAQGAKVNRITEPRTLAEWVQATGIQPTHPTTERGAVSVVVGVEHPLHGYLWHLSDYYADSRSGSVVWLMPRR